VPEAYLSRAEDYRRRSELFPGWRELLVARLGPHQGATVLDIGCGPGLNSAALRAAVGPHGTIIGIDSSPELLTVAAAGVARRGWDNVELVNASAATGPLSVRADAALFAAANDVLADAAAVSNMVAHLRPGAPVAAGGWNWPAPWLWPLRVAVAAWQRRWVGGLTGFDRPWRLLAEHVTDLQIREIGFGTGYLAHATAATPPTQQVSDPVRSHRDHRMSRQTLR
jgi:demethylmenaquinone methyltransferase/2-methoxy-6-polyprenyl-1,4-benzoquinol methylase